MIYIGNPASTASGPRSVHYVLAREFYKVPRWYLTVCRSTSVVEPSRLHGADCWMEGKVLEGTGIVVDRSIDWLTGRLVKNKDPAIGQYQCLLAMRGIMKTRTKPIHRKMEINKPMLFQALRDRRGNIESSKSQMTTVQDTQSDPAQWGDDIEEDDPMSVDDDDDEFDNIFGAGDDLAALAEYWPPTTNSCILCF